MKKTLFLSLVVLCFLLIFSNSSMIRLKIAEFSTDMEIPDFSSMNLTKKAITGDYEYFLVQFNSKTQNNYKKEIEREGGEFFDYIPDNAFIVRMSINAFEKIKNLHFVKFIEIWQPAFRIDPSIIFSTHKPYPEENGSISLLITLFEDNQINDFINNIKDIDILSYEYSGRYIRIKTDETNYKDLAITVANLSEVYWVERDYPNKLHNTWSRWICDTYDTIGMTAILETWYAQMSMNSAADSTRMQLYAHGLYGQDQIIGVDDTGLDWDNVYFRDPSQSIYYDRDNDTICESPNLLHRKVIAYNPFIDTFDLNNSGHGTHTSGSVLADSLGSNTPNDTMFARGMGMAPAAKLVFIDLQNAAGNFLTPTNLSLIYVWAYNAGARITSSSWGIGTGGPSSYTSRSQQLDRIAWDHKDLLMFRSAGNDNSESPPDSVNSPATAKNIVTVGATESGAGSSTSWANPGSTSNNELIDVAVFSSHGPTKEGQLKPEILAPGGWYIWSADSDGNLSTNNNGITYMGGTSMSCPTAAGFAAIVRQYFSKGWYPSGTENSGDSLYPSAALIKAMMINSTRNSPGHYSIDNIDHFGSQNAPSYGQGWGRITLADAIYFNGDVRDLEIYDIAPGFSSSGEYLEYIFKTGSSTDEYTKIVLTYTDYPAGVSPSTVIVNDLNLTVIESGNTYFGNVFNTDARSITGGLYDDKNVTEVVWLDATPNSFISVRIDAEAINNGPQPYAIVITGDIDKTGSSPGIYYYNNMIYDTIIGETIIANSLLNNGETADIDLWIYNNSGASETVSGIVKSLSINGTITDSVLSFGSVANADSANDVFRISISSTTPNNSFIPFMLITNYSTITDTSFFNIRTYGTSIVNLDRDSLVINTEVKKGQVIDYSEHDISTPRIILKDAMLSPSKGTVINLNKNDIKGTNYDTLKYDNGVFDQYWFGPEYWAVGFTPERPCSIKAIWWGRYHNVNETDTLKIWNDSGDNPGSQLYERVVNLRNVNTETFYRSTIIGPYVNQRFWVGMYARTDTTTGNSSFSGGENGSGVNSRYFDGFDWQSLAPYSSNLLIRAEVKYFISIADSGMFYVINNDTASVKGIDIDTITVKNNSTWIADVSPYNGNIPMSDSIGIKVYIDTIGLIPDATYIDTLLIYTNANFSKDIVLQLPVILHTAPASGIENDKVLKDIVINTYFSLSTPISKSNIEINFSLKNSSTVNISVYDIMGREIKSLTNKYLDKGIYELKWNGTDSSNETVGAGIYFIRADMDNKKFIKKAVIIR